MANKSVSLGNVASSQQLPTIDATAVAMPVELQFSAISKGLLWQRRSSRHHVANPGRAVGTIHVFAEPVTVRLMSGYGVKRTHSPCVKRCSLKNPSEKFRYFAAVALKDSKV